MDFAIFADEDSVIVDVEGLVKAQLAASRYHDRLLRSVCKPDSGDSIV